MNSELLISEIISEEFVSNDLKLVYAVIKGFDHYVSFYTSSNVSLKYHCKMYANIDLNKIEIGKETFSILHQFILERNDEKKKGIPVLKTTGTTTTRSYITETARELVT